MADTIMKERALLFLDRRIAAIETTEVNHTEMAEQSVSYAERRRYEASTAERVRKNQQELEALNWIRAVVMGVDPQD